MAKTKKIDQNKMMEILDWSYDKALNGLPGCSTAQELANNYLNKKNSVDEAVNSLIKWQNSKCGTSGFISGLGGIITLPVALPANITSVIYIQIRMIAAIAYMGKYDLKSDQVRSLVYICLCGNSAKDISKNIGIKLGTKLSKSAINKISGKTLTKINQKVGFRLVTKFGQKGVINMGKAIPVVGGLIGGTMDVVATNTIGKVSKKTFINN